MDFRARKRRLRQAFLDTFQTSSGEIVLAHLARYCHATQTAFVLGQPDATAYHNGRRDVFLEIQAYLHLTEDKLQRTLTQEENIHAA